MTDRAIEAGVHIGDFVIEKRLGAGGMGIVYQARQVSLDRRVALKVIGQALTRPTAIARFRREAQAAARLRHDGIAGIYFIGQDAEICYMAMEFVDGTTLRGLLEGLLSGWDTQEYVSIDVIARRETMTDERLAVRFDDAPDPTPAAEPHETLPRDIQTERTSRLLGSSDHIRRCCEIVREVAVALAYAHQQGVIHRDIKPENLMLDRDGRARIIDFGVARFFEDVTLTHTGQLVGTPMYMSPEQVAARFEPDQRTDVYSLGVVLYELLALRPPLEGNTREELLRRIISKPPLPLSWQNPTIPNPVERIVHKAIAKDPDERYENATQFAADLERFLGNQPVNAPAYRYRLDEREIAATRPGIIDKVASVFMALGAVCALAASGLWVQLIGWTVLQLRMLETDGLQTAGAAVLCSGGAVLAYFTGRGLLGGRQWARWVAAICSGLLTIPAGYGIWASLLFFGIAFGSSSGNRDTCATIGIGFLALSLPCLVLCLLTIVRLFRRPVREWFRTAARLRAEHRQERRLAGMRTANSGRGH